MLANICRRDYKTVLAGIIAITTVLKLILLFGYPEILSVNSDDINYYKSAVYFLKSGMLTYQNFNEPTVFIMPGYPLFLSAILRVAGTGFLGLQSIRLVQIVLSAASILLIYRTTRLLSDERAGIISAGVFAFYPPNLLTPGYILTETVFLFLLLLLVYWSFLFAKSFNVRKSVGIAIVWTLAVLIRPTILFYPVFYYIYLLINQYIRFGRMMRTGIAMALVFTVIAMPWWIRNYNEYGEFIPLTVSGGNPMLQGTYINYQQTPENVVIYKLGSNSLETDKIETKVALERIKAGFRSDFSRYLLWFTLGKTFYFWTFPFYWNQILGISYSMALLYHILILLVAMIGITRRLTSRSFAQTSLILMLSLYFNLIHCIYMSFDRYAYPIIGIVTIYTGMALSAKERVMR